MRFLPLLLAAASLFALPEPSPRRAPGFSLPDLNLKQHDLQDYRGKIVLVEFMQTGCPHCVEFSKILEEVQRKYRARVAVLSIVLQPDTQATVREFIARHKVTAPVLFDCGQVAASYLQVTPQKPTINLPHVFIIDENGFIRNDYGYGVLTRNIFEGRGVFQVLDGMLGGKSQK